MIKAIYSTIHSMTSLDEEVRKDVREIWHVASVYVERTIFVSPRLCVRYLNRFVTLKASVWDTEERSGNIFGSFTRVAEYSCLAIYQDQSSMMHRE